MMKSLAPGSSHEPKAHDVSHVTVAIVGAGPAGIGMARVLRDLGVPNVKILERREIGASFRRWPAGMRFITPSFPSNDFGLVDLNAISFDSSPAHLIQREHLNGVEYAAYLEEAVEMYGLDVSTGIEISGLEPDGRDILLHTNDGEIRTHFVVWAAGQFQYPNLADIAGSEHGIHSSQVRTWSEIQGDEVAVVGGHESGIDAAIGLATAGKKVTLLARRMTWDTDLTGATLSPLTAQRLNAALFIQKHPITLISDATITRLDRVGRDVRLIADDGRHWVTSAFPILATGFGSGTSIINRWFEKDACARHVLTDHDESTILSGLFLVGPEVSHKGQPLNFIYKFRQRFAVVAHAIADRLGMDTTPLDAYRVRNMFLDDLHCCPRHEGSCED